MAKGLHVMTLAMCKDDVVKLPFAIDKIHSLATYQQRGLWQNTKHHRTGVNQRDSRRTVILMAFVMRAQAMTLASRPRIRLCISHLLFTGRQMAYQAMNTLAGPKVDNTGTAQAGTVFLVCRG